MRLPFLKTPPAKFWRVEPGDTVSRELAKACAFQLATYSEYAQREVVAQLEGVKPGRRGAKRLRVYAGGYVCWIAVRRDPLHPDQIEIDAYSRVVDDLKLKKLRDT